MALHAFSFETLEKVFTVGNDYGELVGRMVLFLVGFVAWTALVVRAEGNPFGADQLAEQSASTL